MHRRPPAPAAPTRTTHDFGKRKGKPKHDSCFVCRKKIWALLSNDFECSACGASVHSKKCLQQAQLTVCLGPPDLTTTFVHESNTLLGRVHSSHHKKGMSGSSASTSNMATAAGPLPAGAGASAGAGSAGLGAGGSGASGGGGGTKRNPVHTTNLLANHPQNPFQLLVALGGKIYIYEIQPNQRGRELLAYSTALPGIPKAKIRHVQSAMIAPDLPVVVAITTLGAFVYRLDKIEEAPLILEYGTDMGALALKRHYMACADHHRHVTIWDLRDQFAHKSTSTETIVLDENAVAMEFAEDAGAGSAASPGSSDAGTTSRKLIVAGMDGKLRVYRLGVMRGCIAEYDVTMQHARIALREFPAVSFLADQQDTLRVIDSSKLLGVNHDVRARVGSVLPAAAPSVAAGGASGRGGGSANTAMGTGLRGSGVATDAIDKLTIARQQFFRIPSPKPSYPNMFVEFVDALNLAFVANAQTGKVDLVKVMLNRDKNILRHCGTVGDLDVILGLSVATTEEYCYLFTFYSSMEMYCYSINITAYLSQTGVGASVMLPLGSSSAKLAPVPQMPGMFPAGTAATAGPTPTTLASLPSMPPPPSMMLSSPIVTDSTPFSLGQQQQPPALPAFDQNRKSTSPAPMETTPTSASSPALIADESATKRRTRSASDAASTRFSLISPFDSLFDHLQDPHPASSALSDVPASAGNLSPRFTALSRDQQPSPSRSGRKASVSPAPSAYVALSSSTMELVPASADTPPVARRSTSEPERPDSILQHTHDLEQEFLRSVAASNQKNGNNSNATTRAAITHNQSVDSDLEALADSIISGSGSGRAAPSPISPTQYSELGAAPKRGMHQKSHSEMSFVSARSGSGADGGAGAGSPRDQSAASTSPRGHMALGTLQQHPDQRAHNTAQQASDTLPSPSRSSPSLLVTPAATGSSFKSFSPPQEPSWRRTAANRTNLTNTHSFSMKQGSPFAKQPPQSPPSSPSSVSTPTPDASPGLSPPSSPRGNDNSAAAANSPWRFAKRG